jgi:hypothetical protein
MTRVIVCVLYGAMVLGGRGAARPELSGAWILNHELSEFPREVGFDPDWHDSDAGGQTGTGRSSGRGGRGGGGGNGAGNGGGASRVGSVSAPFESEEDSRKIRELVNEVKAPPERLTITETDAAVTVADASGRARSFYPGGKESALELDAGPVGVTAKWENAQLVIRCLIEKDRELRYRYSREAGSSRLVVEVQFADHGRGEIIKRVYDVAPPG